MRLVYILITLFFVSCNSVPKNYLENNTICNYNRLIFNIIENEMSFNVNRLKERELILIDNDYFENRFYSYDDGEITNKQDFKYREMLVFANLQTQIIHI